MLPNRTPNPGKPLFEMMPNLTLQFRSFLPQVASMAGENLELVMDCIDWLFHESKPIHRCAKNGVQIVVIALVVTMFRLAIIARCEWMDESRFIARFSECTHGRLVIVARHFYGDDQVFNIMLSRRLGHASGLSPWVKVVKQHFPTWQMIRPCVL